PELRDALAGLGPGAVSDVLAVPTGFAILQLATDVGPRARIRASEIPGLAAVGSVQATVSVDGFAEANTVLQEFPKPDNDWNQRPQDICRMRTESLREIVASMSSLVDAPEPSAGLAGVDLIQGLVVLGQLHAYSGNLVETIRRFEQALPRARRDFADGLPQLEAMLGIAHLHRAAQVNDVFARPADRCLLSQVPRAYADPQDARKAAGYFEQVLAARPFDGEAAWLLNLAHMAAGTYPAGVPASFRVQPSALASAEDVGRFADVAPAVGLESFSAAGGVVVDDFDNDGALEILTSNFESCGPMHLFRRGADGRYGESSAGAGLAGQVGGLNMVQADYNNDGCRDVLVLRGGWETAQRKSLLKNNCDGTFTDVTAAAGLARPATSTQTAVWADIDNDGWVDLFVGNENVPSQLFRNKGDGTFEDIAATAGVARVAFTKGVASADYDNDGDVDFYVSNLGGGNFLYRNTGKGTFTEESGPANVPGADRGFPTWFFDYDNDGWDDLLVSSYFLSVDESVRAYFGRPLNAHTMKLYRNGGDGRFEDVTVRVGLDKVYMPMGSNFGDIDNDGYLDVYLGTGSPSYGALVPSVLLRNREGQRFVDVTASSGTGELHTGHGVAFADLDDDGDQDIVFKVGGATPGDAHAMRLFENPGHGRAWLGLHLEGQVSNRAAIGARIRVSVEDDRGARRTLHRTVSSGGSFGASPLRQHIGLGAGVRRVDVEIAWPTSRITQRFANLVPNQVVRIRERDDRVEPLVRQARPLTADPTNRPSAGREATREP
ncbi:MAG TPA: CRTAC1 family protein, partial [Vicinamibacterales bacterium]